MPSNMEQYVDEVRCRLPRYEVAQQVDPGLVQLLVNRARHDVQQAMIQYFPERFARIYSPASVTEATEYRCTVGGATRRVYQAQLPADFLQHVVVLYEDESGVYEARELSMREMATTLDSIFTGPTLASPVYSIIKDPLQSAHTLFISAGANVLTSSGVTVWYLAALPYMQLVGVGAVPDLEVRLGWDFEELVVLLATLKVIETLAGAQGTKFLMADIERCLSFIESNYRRTIDRKKLLLPSREAIVPNQIVPEVIQPQA